MGSTLKYEIRLALRNLADRFVLPALGNDLPCHANRETHIRVVHIVVHLKRLLLLVVALEGIRRKAC